MKTRLFPCIGLRKTKTTIEKNRRYFSVLLLTKTQESEHANANRSRSRSQLNAYTASVTRDGIELLDCVLVHQCSFQRFIACKHMPLPLQTVCSVACSPCLFLSRSFAQFICLWLCVLVCLQTAFEYICACEILLSTRKNHMLSHTFSLSVISIHSWIFTVLCRQFNLLPFNLNGFRVCMYNRATACLFSFHVMILLVVKPGNAFIGTLSSYSLTIQGKNQNFNIKYVLMQLKYLF